MKDIDKTSLERRIFLDSILAILFSIGILLIVDYFLKFVPNNLDLDFIQKTYNVRLGFFVAEKPELYQYIFSTILFPILFSIFYKILSGFKTKNTKLTIGFSNYIEVVVIIALVVLGQIVLPQEWVNNISMLNFSIIIAVIVFIIYGSILFVLWKNIKNKFIAVVGMISIVYSTCSFYDGKNGYYLQYLPHRILGPVLLLLVVSIYLNTKKELTKKVLYVAGFVVGAFAFFWNFDTGVIVVAAWALFLIYNLELTNKLNEKKLYIESLKIIGLSLIEIIAVILLIFMITFFRTGQLIHLSDMIAGQFMFLGSGFYMLPMKFFHPWMLLILIYFFALAKSLRNMAFVRVQNSKYSKTKSSLYFFLSVLGLGIFSYYQGRSHDAVFILIIWPGIILGCLFIQEYLVRINEYFKSVEITKKSFFSIKIVVLFAKPLLIFILIASFAVYFVNYSFSQNIKNYATNLTLPVPFYRLDVENFIKQNKAENEQVDLLIEYFEEYYTVLGVKNPMDIRSSIDWFTKEDYAKVINWLEKTTHTVFIDVNTENLLIAYVPKEFNSVLERRFNLKINTNSIKVYTLKAAES